MELKLSYSKMYKWIRHLKFDIFFFCDAIFSFYEFDFIKWRKTRLFVAVNLPLGRAFFIRKLNFLSYSEFVLITMFKNYIVQMV